MTGWQKGGLVSAGRGFIAKGIQSGTINRLASDRARLEACESLLRYYLPQLYDNDDELDAATNVVAGTFLSKTGEFLCCQQGVEDDKSKKILAKLEMYVRKAMPAEIGLPEACLLPLTQTLLHKEAADSRRAKEKEDKKRKGPCATPTIGPHAEFTGGGDVVQSAAVRAALLGMDVGARVSFKRKSAKRDAGARGTIVGFTETMAIVKVDDDSGDGAKVPAGIGALALVDEDNEDDGDGEVAADSGAGGPSTLVDWELSADGGIEAVYNANVVIAIFQLHVGVISTQLLTITTPWHPLHAL